jgi:hypothetical protein
MAFETAAVSASFEVVDSPVMSSFEIDSGSVVRFAEVTGTVVSSMMAVTHGGATMVAGVAMVMVMVANTLMGGHSSSALARNWAFRYPTSISSSSAFKSGITSVFITMANLKDIDLEGLEEIKRRTAIADREEYTGDATFERTGRRDASWVPERPVSG